MKYLSTLPISALCALALLTGAVQFGLITDGASFLEALKEQTSGYLYWLCFIVIFLESIIFLGFYLPGQFFAVLLVLSTQATLLSILKLTVVMVLAATLGSAINFYLGRRSRTNLNQDMTQRQKISFSSLLVAMMHINSLAFFMFTQGAKNQRPVIIALAGLLNLPYYLLLIGLTTLLSEQVMALAENNLLIMYALFVWLAVSLFLDLKRSRVKQNI